MIRKAIALAVAAMVSFTGPAIAADASATASKAAAADTVKRASLPQGSDQLTGDSDFLIFLAFGLLTTAVVLAAWNDDEEPSSP
jgi:hypothetical protein